MRFRRSASLVGALVLALLAYVPALMSSPGRMPADTKLYLYLDPGGLLGRAASTFEPDQFAGWVPHQQITYLWPSGPWFWLFEAAAIPDWVAHRLWIGTIMFLAGLGARWAARRLGLSPAAALVAGVAYQTMPFLLPYISRTSLLLLPWAGLGWIVGLTIRATAQAPHTTRLARWRDPALIALIVATVGSGNATALLMVVPAPAIWLALAARDPARRVHVVAVTAATAGLCVVVSLWWVAMLVVQARHGAPVLSYSETLGDVSRNSTGSEILRSLGYWLFYVRDEVAPATSASTDYLISTRTIVVSYLAPLMGLAGLALSRWRHRAFAAALVAAGAVLAAGVHPIGDPSPLVGLLTGDDESGLALALRSSTRAIPVLTLGLALGAGALVGSLRRPRLQHVGAFAIVALFVVNLPALWSAALVDEAIDRDADVPTAWSAAAADLDARAEGYRTMQLPGAEFGAFRWGYTVDQPVVALTDRPLVTRDLLPLGSAAAMDLLYAFDDRLQSGVLEDRSVAPVARLFGADTLWLTNDQAFERFRSPRVELVDRQIADISALDGVGLVERYGEPTVNVADVPMIDPVSLGNDLVGTPVAPVAIAEVVDALPVIRAKADQVLLSGSGDGVVDAAGAGLIDGTELIRYSASLTDDEMTAMITDPRSPARVIVTDSNRDRARHWRGSQDVVGHTEPGGPDDDVTVSTPADQRLAMFDGDVPEQQTVAVLEGPVTPIASSYGEPFAYRPEDRAAMAVDGDASTAWRVGDHGEPVGEEILLTIRPTGGPTSVITVLQAAARLDGSRRITDIDVAAGDAPVRRVTLDDSSLVLPGQRIEIDPIDVGDTLRLTIAAVVRPEGLSAAARSSVGFAEIDLGLGATIEYLRPPIDALQPGIPALDVVLTRHRVGPADPWRHDPETTLRRIVPLPEPETFDVVATLRFDANAPDDVVAPLLGDTARSSARLRGAPARRGQAAVDGDPATRWITPFDGAVGALLSLDVDGVTGPLTVTQPDGDFSRITALGVRRGDAFEEVRLDAPDPDGLTTLPVSASSLAAEAGPLELTILEVDERITVDRRYGDRMVLPASISEVGGIVGSAAGGGDEASPGATGVRSDCDDRWLSIDGVGIPLSFTATAGQLLAGDAIEARSCGPVALAAGEHRIVGASNRALHLDRVTMSTGPADDQPVLADVIVERSTAQDRSVVVSSCPRGCWLVLGEGFNPAWSARSDEGDLGPPVLVDGGFNGWWIEPTQFPTPVSLSWTAQTPVTVSIWLSVAAVIVCLLLVSVSLSGKTSRRRLVDGRDDPADDQPTGDQPAGDQPAGDQPTGDHTLWTPWRPGPPSGARSARRDVTALLLVGASTALLISPVAGAIAAAVVVVDVLLDRRWGLRTLESAGLMTAIVVSVGVVWIERREAPFPNAGWTTVFEHLHVAALLAVVLLAAGALMERRP